MLELLKEAVPKASRIAILVNSSFGLHATALAEAEPAARRIVNLKTARAIGVVVPQSLLQRADEVIQ